MASGSFLSCCNGFEPVDSSETAATGLSRSVYSRYKHPPSLNSPKSSLKNITSTRSFKKSQTSQNLIGERKGESRNTHPTQPMAIEGLQVVSQPNHTNITPAHQQTQTLGPQFRRPGAQKQCYLLHEVVSFSPADHHHSRKVLSLAPVPSNHAPLMQDSSTRHAQQYTQPIGSSETVRRLQYARMQPKVQPRCSRGTKPKIILGGSKFTLLSQGEAEEPVGSRQVRLQQSDIIVDVFHPTESQLQKWHRPADSQMKSAVP